MAHLTELQVENVKSHMMRDEDALKIKFKAKNTEFDTISRPHNEVEDYAPYYDKWDKETFCNTALTLIHQADKGLMTLLQKMEAEFLAEGGVKERMFAARKNQRGF